MKSNRSNFTLINSENKLSLWYSLVFGALLGFWASIILYEDRLGINWTIWYLSLIGSGAIISKLLKRTKFILKNILFGIILFISTLPFALKDVSIGFLWFFMYFPLMILVFLWSLENSNYLQIFSVKYFLNLLLAFVINAFSTVVEIPVLAIKSLLDISRSGKLKGLGKWIIYILLGLIGIIIAIFVVLVIVLPLLSLADPIFGDIVNTLLGEIFYKALVDFFTSGRFIMALFFGGFSFVLLFMGTRKQYKFPISKMELKISRQNIIEYLLLVTPLLGGLIFAYALFIIFQIQYLFSGESYLNAHNVLVSEYARKGFWELIAVSIVNLSVIYVSKLASKMYAQGKLTKIVLTIVSGLQFVVLLFNVVIIGSAFKRVGLYIDLFGLTTARLKGIIFMVIIVLALLALLFVVWSQNMQYLNMILTVWVLLWYVISLLVPFNVIISLINVYRFTKGSFLDSDYLATYYDEDDIGRMFAVDAIIDNKRLSHDDKVLFCSTFKQIREDYKDDSLITFNLVRWIVTKKAKSVKNKCSGYEDYNSFDYDEYSY